MFSILNMKRKAFRRGVNVGYFPGSGNAKRTGKPYADVAAIQEFGRPPHIPRRPFMSVAAGDAMLIDYRQKRLSQLMRDFNKYSDANDTARFKKAEDDALRDIGQQFVDVLGDEIRNWSRQ